jgi:hypothetical protein
LKTLATVIALGVALAMTFADADAARRNNPPGPRGGPGTNWRNPPGPVGGPGASRFERSWRRTFIGGVVWVWHPLNHCWVRDNDQNPPGPRGGPGTNWENPPGPIGGPGASPDRRAC